MEEGLPGNPRKILFSMVLGVMFDRTVNNNYKDKKSLHLLTHFPKPVPEPSWGAGDAITIYPKICVGRMLDMLVRSENQSQMWGVAILTDAARSNTHLGDFFNIYI